MAKLTETNYAQKNKPNESDLCNPHFSSFILLKTLSKLNLQVQRIIAISAMIKTIKYKGKPLLDICLKINIGEFQLILLDHIHMHIGQFLGLLDSIGGTY